MPSNKRGHRRRFERQFQVIPATGQIYDITHADALEHTVALPAGYDPNTEAMIVRCIRQVGAGNFNLRSVSGGTDLIVTTQLHGLWVRADDGLFYYRLTVANDDWDVYCVGYLTR